MKYVTVMFCCNDPRNGRSTGHVSQISLDDPEIFHLEGPIGDLDRDDDPDGVPFARGCGICWIDGSRYEVKSEFTYGVGNWCWDAAQMRTDEFARLVNNLRTSKVWSINVAESGLFDKWKAGQDLTAADFDAVLEATA